MAVWKIADTQAVLTLKAAHTRRVAKKAKRQRRGRNGNRHQLE